MKYAALILLALVSPAWAWDINRSTGGSMDDFAAVIAASPNEPWRIEGLCASACTLFLGARNVCADPEATLGFHSASTPLGNEMFLRAWPAGVRKWASAHGVLSSVQVQYMTGAEAIRLGVRACN